MQIVNDKTCAWINDLNFRSNHKILYKDQECDWLIVGAGYTGLSAARKLSELHPSQKIIIVDAQLAGEGASGRNSGYLVDTTLNDGFTSNKEFSNYKKKTDIYQMGIKAVKKFIKEHQVDCDWNEAGKYFASSKKEDKKILISFTNILSKLGFKHKLFDKREFDAALRDVDFCNTEISRVRSLETLYALERIDEIYNRIENQSESDDKNLRMAAFSSFISAREKKETEHNFCRNPLSFIHYSNISSHLGNSTEFVKEVIDELNNVKTIWEPLGKSALKGFVTTSEFNLFASPSGKLAQLKSIIFDEIDAYYLKFRKESCSYITKWPSKINLYGWHVVLKQQGCQTAHIHPSGWLSGVIYLKVVPPLGKDEGAIEFSLNGKNYYDVNSPSLTFQPELGDIVFFPSSLHHRTIPYMTDTDRIIVSFDLMPEAAKQ